MQYNDKEHELHNSRIMFAILSDGTFVSKSNTSMGHKEWLETEHHISDEQFEQIIRGYYKNNSIVAYKGSEFGYDDEVETALTTYYPQLVNLITDTNINYVHTYAGVIVGNIGDEWEPAKYISTWEL